jgi:hypothetical protein
MAKTKKAKMSHTAIYHINALIYHIPPLFLSGSLKHDTKNMADSRSRRQELTEPEAFAT